MEGIDYAFLRDRVDRLIESDPTTATLHNEDSSWTVTGRLGIAGSRTFGRTGQSFQLAASELTGAQLYTLLVPYDTVLPRPADEVRTLRQGVAQRFSVVQCLPSPWKVDILLDEVT